MADDRGPLSEEQAREIWRRAARLQAEAAQRLEARSREVAARGEAPPSDGYSPGDVEAAAVEAGIGREFVKLAIAEAQQPERHGLSPLMDGLATRVLGTNTRSVEVSRVIDASPPEVFEAMQRLFPQYPYRLSLRDSIGARPTEGGVLVFAVPSYFSGTGGEFALDMAYADLKELNVVMRPVPGADGHGTEVVISSDLNYSRKLNVWVGGAFTGTGGLGAGAVAGGVSAAAGAAGAILALPVAAGALLGAGLFRAGYRALYRWGTRRGVRAV